MIEVKVNNISTRDVEVNGTPSGNVGATGLISVNVTNGLNNVTPEAISVVGNDINLTVPGEYIILTTENTTNLNLRIDTSGAQPYIIEWGDGTTTTGTSGGTFSKTYGTPFTGVIKVRVTPSNVLRIESSLNIFNFNTTLTKQTNALTQLLITGQNILSGNINNLQKTLLTISISGSNTITGDIINTPSSAVFLQVLGNNTLTGNISTLPATLTSFNIQGSNVIVGDIFFLPSGITTFNCQGLNQVNQYTAGRVWANNMRQIVHRPAAGFGLTTTMVDNMLIDLSVVTTWLSPNTVDLRGNNAPRSAASNAAVTTLTGNGVTVLTN